jgi:U3 small nucleolar RNA-associated protein 7
VKNIRDKKLRGNLKSLEAKYKTAALQAKDAEILHENTSGFLEPENELERTYKVRQEDILEDVPVETAKKRFELKLDALGPYVCDYTRNGREGKVILRRWTGAKESLAVNYNSERQ